MNSLLPPGRTDQEFDNIHEGGHHARHTKNQWVGTPWYGKGLTPQGRLEIELRLRQATDSWNEEQLLKLERGEI